MKPWLIWVFVVFFTIAGYKLFGYQHQLSESNADKARLNSVLARSKATEASELKVIKPAPKLSLVSNPENKAFVDSADEELGTSQQRSEIELSLNTFFALHPSSKQFVVSSVKCAIDRCQIVGHHSGTQSDLYDLVDALENEPWWEFGAPAFISTKENHGEAVTISVSLKSQGDALTAVSAY